MTIASPKPPMTDSLRGSAPARIASGLQASAALTTVLLLMGCTAFRPLPLDSASGATSVADVVVSAASMPTATLRAYSFDATNGLDVTEVAMLAVANDPQLKAQRDAAGVKAAQAYAAGLLPDPQMSLARDYPHAGKSGTTIAYTQGLSFNLGDLVTRSARVASARAGVREVDLNLLWSEWQVIAQARTLFDRTYYLRQVMARYEREQDALAPMQSAVARALRAGDLTYEVAATGLDAASNVANQMADTQRQLNLADHDLHNLLGLDVGVPLHLTGAPFAVDPAAEVQHALAEMAQRRPDLLALQAGYESQNASLRAAILAQFPAITVGFTRARDNGNVSSSGFTVGLSLPLFNGNRGHIAVERATRQKLHDEYSARLVTDRNEVRRLLADLDSARSQRAVLALHAEELTNAREAAGTNYAAGRLDWPTYLALRASSLSTDAALLKLEQTAHETAIALDALVGDWPQAAPGKLHETSTHASR